MSGPCTAAARAEGSRPECGSPRRSPLCPDPLVARREQVPRRSWRRPGSSSSATSRTRASRSSPMQARLRGLRYGRPRAARRRAPWPRFAGRSTRSSPGGEPRVGAGNGPLHGARRGQRRRRRTDPRRGRRRADLFLEPLPLDLLSLTPTAPRSLRARDQSSSATWPGPRPRGRRPGVRARTAPRRGGRWHQRGGRAAALSRAHAGPGGDRGGASSSRRRSGTSYARPGALGCWSTGYSCEPSGAAGLRAGSPCPRRPRRAAAPGGAPLPRSASPPRSRRTRSASPSPRSSPSYRRPRRSWSSSSGLWSTPWVSRKSSFAPVAAVCAPFSRRGCVRPGLQRDRCRVHRRGGCALVAYPGSRGNARAARRLNEPRSAHVAVSGGVPDAVNRVPGRSDP